MFDDNFIDSLPNDPLRAAYALCARFREVNSEILASDEVEEYQTYVEALGVFEGFCEVYGFDYSSPKLGANKTVNIKAIQEFFNVVYTHLENQIANATRRAARERFKKRVGSDFFYEFSEGDLNRIQGLLNELRDIITRSETFDASHKDRVLKKLEALQSELHKRMSSLDKFWALIGEAGVALGKFGKDAKPFVDRIREILQIVWWTQARAEGLPSSTPLPLLAERESKQGGTD